MDSRSRAAEIEAEEKEALKAKTETQGKVYYYMLVRAVSENTKVKITSTLERTTIEIDANLHPSDVDFLKQKIHQFLRSETDTSKRFANFLNNHIKELNNRIREEEDGK